MSFLNGAEDVCFRDKYSYELFSTIPQVRYATDLVFNLDTSQIQLTNRKRVVFSIIDCNEKMNQKYTKAYEQKMIEMTKFALSQGYEVCYMSFCRIEKDEEAIERIIGQCDEQLRKQIQTYYYRGNIQEALQILADCQAIVGARFHSNILGLLFQKTIIPVIYSDKTKKVLEDISFQGKMVDIENISDLQMEKIWNKENLNYQLDITDIKENAKKQFEGLDKILKKG